MELGAGDADLKGAGKGKSGTGKGVTKDMSCSEDSRLSVYGIARAKRMTPPAAALRPTTLAMDGNSMLI